MVVFFFHIDFGHLFNNKPLVDAPRMSIPEGIQKNLTEREWDDFRDLCSNGFEVLYRNGSLVRNLCRMLFESKYKSDWLEEFIGSHKSLMLSQSCLAATARIQKHIATGSSKWNMKKQIKYSTHNVKYSTNVGVSEIMELPIKYFEKRDTQSKRETEETKETAKEVTREKTLTKRVSGGGLKFPSLSMSDLSSIRNGMPERVVKSGSLTGIRNTVSPRGSMTISVKKPGL